jgi:hypothetical protein
MTLSDSQSRPKVVGWFRAYALFMSVVGASFLVILLFALTRVQQMLPNVEIEADELGFLGTLLLAVYVPPLFFPRKPWVWTYDLVLICLGMSSCFAPFCIPLLIFWIKPAAKQYFGRSA